MKFISRSTWWLILLVTACTIYGCAAYTVEYVSVVEGDLSKTSAKIELGKSYALIRPHNEYASGTAIAPVYVPLIPIPERRFSSRYYMPRGHYADFSDIGTSPSFFIVEVLFISVDSEVVVNVSSLHIVEESKDVQPAVFWISDPIDSDVKQIRTSENLCKDPRLPGEQLTGGQPVANTSVTVERGRSVCMILKYPIPPVIPTMVFRFEVNNLQVDGKQLPVIRVTFVGKRVVGVHAIQPGP